MQCDFTDAVKDSQWHRSKLVRVGKYMRQSERWLRAPETFERGNRLALPDPPSEVSGEITEAH